MPAAAVTPSDASDVLVCGLGRLGQHCVTALELFGVAVHGVDLRPPEQWGIGDITPTLTSLSVGDCRAAHVLERAQLARCRAALLVTNDERVNIVAAFAVRSLQPHIRIVIRSGQKNLNTLLAGHLGNFVAYEPNELSAPAFALAALGDDTGQETTGLFQLEERLMRVVRVQVTVQHPFCGSSLGELNTSSRRVVGYRSSGETEWCPFHTWAPDACVKPGDVVATIEHGGPRGSGRWVSQTWATDSEDETSVAWWRGAFAAFTWPALKARAARVWSGGTQMQRVALAAAPILLSLYLLGALFYLVQYPDIAARDALNVGMVLILGGYDNLFGQLRLPFPIPVWLHVFSVLLSVSGTVGIGILYAFLTERVLSVRFQFRRHRPPLPRSNHTVLIGMGPIGERIAAFLLKQKQPLVVLHDEPGTSDIALGIPYVVGKLKDSIDKVRLRSAASLIALTDHEVDNLEAALVARTANPRCRVIIRSDDTLFSENVAKLVVGARSLGVYALAAEAFATAAFGESVHGLVRIGDRTSVVTEYLVSAGDTLLGRLIGEVGYGFGVVPVLLQREGKAAECFPSDDTRLQENDRLVVLATTEGLRDIEYGSARAPEYRVHIDAAASPDAGFEGAITMVRISGCDLALAQTVIQSLPATLEALLYRHQADRLVRELGKARVVARWIHQKRD